MDVRVAVASLIATGCAVVAIAWLGGSPLGTPQAGKGDAALTAMAGSGQSFRDRKANGDRCPSCPEMVVVPAGNFTMGSPQDEPERDRGETQVTVSIARPFAVAKFSVTFDEWDACVADGGCNGYKPDDARWLRGTRPVINVSWHDAKAYVAWLSAQTGKTYRLPSEAEREYVTRAGTATPFWWGREIAPEQANYDRTRSYAGGSTAADSNHRTLPIQNFKANPWGLYQVHGNVDEWTQDCWHDSNIGNPADGSARSTGDCTRRVLRGGNWDNDPSSLRAAARFGVTADPGSIVIGFRVARSLAP
ncbi:MAG: formylglycine-generating enzyme family protein [Reyranellaceae bacterium]